MSTYDIRWYRPADRAQFIDLYAEVLDTWHHSPEWFDWKYVSNPYVDHVPIVVATADDDLVGARSFFALPMAVGGESYRALQPCDTMVRPDRRRNGLFTRMTELAIDRYEEREPAFFFNFPNEVTLRGNRKLGWRRVGTVPVAYRVEAVTPLLATRTRAPGHRLAGGVATGLVAAHNGLRDRLATTQSIAVSLEESVPVETLVDVYADTAPATIHARRDPDFYRWRLSNPNWNYAAFLGEADGERAALVIARTPPGKQYGPEVTRVADVVPLTDHRHRGQLLGALLAEVRGSYPSSDLFVAPATIPGPVLRA